MLNDRSGPKCERALVVPGNNHFRIVGGWERYWRHWVTDSLGQTHFIPCGGVKSNCKMCAYVRANWDSNPNVQQWKVGSASLFNVVDRRDNWCEKNNHTKVLCQWKSEIGVGPMIFEELKETVNINGSWDGKDGKGGDWDLIITKSGSGAIGTSYKCQATRDKIELTEEEKKYERYDLKSLMPPPCDPQEIDDIISGMATATSETSPPEALTVDELKVPVKSEAKVEVAATVAKPAVKKVLSSPKPEPPKKKNKQACETNDCKGFLEFNDDEKEVTCPVCKTSYGLEPSPTTENKAKEDNPFDS